MSDLTFNLFILWSPVFVIVVTLIVYLFYSAAALNLFGGSWIDDYGLPSPKELFNEWRRRR